jgi:hypothetical protein
MTTANTKSGAPVKSSVLAPSTYAEPVAGFVSAVETVLCSVSVPAGPVLPVFPVIPVIPVFPVIPVIPVFPVRPVFPVSPVLPVGPCAPVPPFWAIIDQYDGVSEGTWFVPARIA